MVFHISVVLTFTVAQCVNNFLRWLVLEGMQGLSRNAATLQSLLKWGAEWCPVRESGGNI